MSNYSGNSWKTPHAKINPSQQLAQTTWQHTISSHKIFNAFWLSTTIPQGWCRAFRSFTMENPFHVVSRLRFSLELPHAHTLLVSIHPIGCKSLPSLICRQMAILSHHRLLLHSEHNITINKLSRLRHPSPSTVPFLCFSCALTMNHKHDHFLQVIRPAFLLTWFTSIAQPKTHTVGTMPPLLQYLSYSCTPNLMQWTNFLITYRPENKNGHKDFPQLSIWTILIQKLSPDTSQNEHWLTPAHSQSMRAVCFRRIWT